ncbi:MAG TPA: E3 binding domain-containing protein, partial [Solirubrobacteraceae bacterium]|nr:E3 binding domain-containing protein [Solirubrobacteraceae bacterium]
MTEIVMPRLSDTMEEGTILRWLKADGDKVKRGEELVEIETDKAAMVYESDQEGTLAIVAAEGATLAVGEVIAHVGETSDSHPATAPAADDEAPATAAAPATPTPPATAPASPPAPPTHDDERVKASPLAKRIAKETGIDLHNLTGSGPGGRIVKADIESASQAASPAHADVATAKGETTTVELTRTQQTIARRMAESKATIPDFSIQMDVDMEECATLRGELKRLSRADAP